MDISFKFKRLKFTDKLNCLIFVIFKLIFSIDLSKQLELDIIERKLIYLPVIKENINIYESLKDKINFLSFISEGVEIDCWYVKPSSKKITVLYCHGQGENITGLQHIIEFLVSKGYGVFIPQYRGHSHCNVLPDEQFLYMDLLNAVDFLEKTLDISQENIVLWGKSLGGAVASATACDKKVKALIVDSSFTSLSDLALFLTKKNSSAILSKLIDILPITQKFDTLSIIDKITCPILIAHSKLDATVPAEMAKELYGKAKNAKLFLSETGTHEESEWSFAEVEDFLSDFK